MKPSKIDEIYGIPRCKTGEICTQSNALAKDHSCPAKRQTQRTTTLGEKPENYEGGGMVEDGCKSESKRPSMAILDQNKNTETKRQCTCAKFNAVKQSQMINQTGDGQQ